MAGHNSFRDSLEEDPSIINVGLFKHENLILSNHNLAQPSSSTSSSTTANPTQPQNALITTSPIHHLGLRQNNPQDCSNLVSALVDRATVEISRTIIALNATFSQQLQQASISASNGIKQAQVSATSTISIVVQSASIATSSAFSSVTVANKAVASANIALTSVQDSITSVNLALQSAQATITSANSALSGAQSTITSVNFALTNVSSSSSSDVSRLSSSISLLQASVVSAQASASAAIAAAQSALASATGSAAAQASSILASAARNTPAASIISAAPGSPTSIILPQPAVTSSSNLSLTPGQAAGIVVGVVVFSLLICFVIYFLIRRMKKMRERDSYLDEKDPAGSPRRLPSRLSSAFRTGNEIKIKFNPPKSPQARTPGRSAIRKPDDFPIISSGANKRESNINVEELGSSPLENIVLPLASPVPFLSSDFTTALEDPNRPKQTEWPLESKQIRNAPRYISDLESSRREEIATAISYSLAPAKTQVVMNSYPILSGGATSSAPRKPTFGKAAPKKVAVNVMNPFDVQTPTRIPEQDVKQPETRQPISLPIVEHNEISMSDEPLETSNTIIPEVEDKSTKEPLEIQDEKPENPFQDPVEVPAKRKVRKPLIAKPRKEFNLEELLSPKATRVPLPATLALLRDEEEPRNSTVPEIDQLLRMVTKQNKNYSDTPLFWSDFRPPDPEVESTLLAPFPTEFSIAAEESLNAIDESVVEEPTERAPSPVPQTPTVEIEKIEIRSNFSEPPTSDIVDTRERTVSPVSRNLLVDIPNVSTALPDSSQDADRPQQELTPPQPEIIGQRDVSPLRRNPQIRNITSLLAEYKADSEPEAPAEEEESEPEPEPYFREERGRSMIRTSDLIEARLSWKSQLNQEEITTQEMALKERTVSPLSRNPVNLEAVAADRRAGTISLFQRKKSNGSLGKRRPKTPSPPPHPQLHPIPMPSEETSIKHEPQIILSQPIPAPRTLSFRSNSTPRPTSNAQFSQALSKFQDLASKNPNNTSIASNEVTQRAIAGIYIPGSLREQAVRNLSRGQESGLNSRSGSQRR